MTVPRKTRVAALGVVAALLLSGFAATPAMAAEQPDPRASVKVERFWSKKFDNAHFYTIDAAEAKRVRTSDRNWAYEGTDFRVYPLVKGACRPGTVAVHRFWSKSFTSHFYTTDAAEAKRVRNTDRNWAYEGLAYCTAAPKAAGTVPVYRFWSPKFRKHFFTVDAAETRKLRDHDRNWNYEGVAFYAPSDAAVDAANKAAADKAAAEKKAAEKAAADKAAAEKKAAEKAAADKKAAAEKAAADKAAADKKAAEKAAAEKAAAEKAAAEKAAEAAAKQAAIDKIGDSMVIPESGVSGQPIVGQTLTNLATYAPAQAVATWSWLRNGKPIAGATGKTYKLVAADRGQKIRARLELSYPGYNGTIGDMSAELLVR